jgi:hypothetical protein
VEDEPQGFSRLRVLFQGCPIFAEPSSAKEAIIIFPTVSIAMVRVPLLYTSITKYSALITMLKNDFTAARFRPLVALELPLPAAR